MPRMWWIAPARGWPLYREGPFTFVPLWYDGGYLWVLTWDDTTDAAHQPRVVRWSHLWDCQGAGLTMMERIARSAPYAVVSRGTDTWRAWWQVWRGAAVQQQQQPASPVHAGLRDAATGLVILAWQRRNQRARLRVALQRLACCREILLLPGRGQWYAAAQASFRALCSS